MSRYVGIPDALDALSPRASATGPFARRPFLTSVTEFMDESPITVEVDGAALVVIEGEDGEVRLAGDSDLTDYHCPLGADPKPVVSQLVDDAGPTARFRFDSLPGEVATEVAEAFASAGLKVTTEQHEVAAVLELRGSFDDYLSDVGKKQRHEIRRKRRRYEEAVGEIVHEVHRGQGWALDEFFRLHRMAEGEKGSFMTPEREEFFRRLVDQPGWRVDALRIPDTDRASACCFSFADDEGVYLYNSSYDVDLGDASPGVAMVGSMIERATVEGLPRFDFLKGDEVYKFRLGASERPLFEVRASA